MSNKRSPDNTIPTERGGEYALEGFRYQAAYTARLCLELLLEGTVFEEIFCEHHEDVVIKLTNGSFIAIQIKHNKPTNPRLSSSHDQILKTLKRFVSFENEFKGMFSRYIIVSNNFAWSTQKNYRNMKLFLDAAKQYDDLDITKKNAFDSVVENICKSCGINQDDLLNVLKKTYNESAYDYYDYEKMLSVDIGENTNNETLSMYRLILIEKKLISKILECSCINCDHPKKEYFTVLGLPKIEQIKHQISHKRIQKQDVEEIIQYYKKPEFKLTTINENEINDIPIGFKIMEQKMILGGINSKTIKNVKNHKRYRR